MPNLYWDRIITDRGPFTIELIGHTIRVVGSNGGDVLVIGNASRSGVRQLAESVKNLLNAAREGLADA